MNFNKDLYEKSEAKEFGEFETLQLGGHEIVIKDAREYSSEFSGKTSLKVCVDIAGADPQKDFFKKQYDEAVKNKKDGEEVKWSNGAIKYLSLQDEQLGYLKGFITACEKSNKDFKFNKDGEWKQLNGLKLAGVFGWEEYNKEDGSIGVATKLLQFRSLEKLKEIKIPDVKTLDGEYIPYDEYKTSSKKKETTFVEISDEDLPF